MKMLVEHGTLRLDEAPFVPVDHVTIDGHQYSDKPPVLPAIGAALYAALHRAGFELYGSDPEKREHRRQREHRFAVLMITFVLVGLSSSGVAAWFYRQLGWLSPDQATRLGLWLSFAFGTLFFSYSVELNNHVVGGAALWGAFAVVFLGGPRDGEPAKPTGFAQHRLAALAGLLAGLAVVIDPPAGAVFLPGFACELWCRGRTLRWARLLWFAAGLTAPLAAHCALQPLVTGSILPAQWYYPKYFPEALQAEAGPSEFFPRLHYTAKILFGQFGYLWMTPTLFFALPGLLNCLGRSAPLRRAAVATAIATAILVIYYGFSAPANHGGEAYGFRWFIAVTPIWYYFACNFYVDTQRRWARWVFWGCAVVAIVAATSGAQNPWLREHGNWWLIGKVLA